MPFLTFPPVIRIACLFSVLASLCKELTIGSPLERRIALAEEALTIAKSSGVDATIIRVLSHISYPLMVPSLLGQSLDWSADALARAERVGDPVLMFFAADQRLTVAGRAGDIDEADRCLEIASSMAEQLDQPTLNWVNINQRAMRALIAGNVYRAEELATEALQIGTDGGEPDAFIFYGALL